MADDAIVVDPRMIETELASGRLTPYRLRDLALGWQSEGRADLALTNLVLARALDPALRRRDPLRHSSNNIDAQIDDLRAEDYQTRTWMQPVPEDAPASFRWAAELAMAGNLVGAEAQFLRCIETGVLPGLCWLHIAFLRTRRTLPGEAYEAIQAAIAAGELGHRTAQMLGRICYLLFTFGHDRLDEGRKYYDMAVAACGGGDEGLMFEVGSFLWERLGDYPAACAAMEQGAQLRDRRLAEHPLGRLGVVSIGRWTYALGSMCHDFEYLVKMIELGWVSGWRPCIATPPGRWANVEIVRYFKQYFTVVEDLDQCESLSDALDALDVNPGIIRIAGRKFQWSFDLHADVQKEWEAQRRPAIFSISAADAAQGRAVLSDRFGVPKDAWYVSFYLRNHGYKPQRRFDDYRSMKFENYLPAMRRVVEQGGWAIWFGDFFPDVGELGERIIPYATSDLKGDAMDLFFWATSRFFVGGHGGGSFPPRLFDTPVLFAELSALSPVSWKACDRFLPRRIWARDQQRFLTLQDTRRAPYFGLLDGGRLESLGLEPQHAESDVIVEAVDEMLQSTDPTPSPLPDDVAALQIRYQHALAQLDGVKTPHLTAGFLRRYGEDYLA